MGNLKSEQLRTFHLEAEARAAALQNAAEEARIVERPAPAFSRILANVDRRASAPARDMPARLSGFDRRGGMGGCGRP